jgi:3-deoxy-D-manno-octulosonate 8-phosphate phosphatase (KDO 8-P phosphatase)
MNLHSNTIEWNKIKGICLDCDGVLTDGRVYFGDDGISLRAFDIRDGLGLVNLMKRGVRVAIVSSSKHASVKYRADELSISDVYISVLDKKIKVEEICMEWGITPDLVAYIGDDTVDINPMKLVGFPIALSDAVPEVKEISCWIAKKPGGRGGVREVCDMIIKSKEN